MTKKDFFTEIETIIEAGAGTVTGDKELASLEGWDSLAVMGFIAMLDEKLNLKVPPQRIAACKTADDLAALAADKISG